jgi:hypothetical protein
MQLRFILVMQVLALIIGAFSVLHYHLIAFSTIAMLAWGGITSVSMLMVAMIGRSDLLNHYGAKASILAMIFINIFFIVFPATSK